MCCFRGKLGHLAYLNDAHTLQGPSCLHRMWESRERKGSGKKMVAEAAIFILCYSCVHFSDQLGSKKLDGIPLKTGPNLGGWGKADLGVRGAQEMGEKGGNP